MIVYEHRLRGVSNVLAYVARTGRYRDRAEDVEGPVLLLNVGLSVLGLIDLDMAKVIVSAVSNMRRDLKNRGLHITLSPAPEQIARRGEDQTRHDCLVVLAHSLREVGAAGRIGLVAFHRNDHGAGHHLQAVVALPCPETGRSISLHRLRERLREAVREAKAALPALETDSIEAPFQAPVWRPDQEREKSERPIMPLIHPALSSNTKTKTSSKRRRRRKKSRGMEL